MQFGRSARWDSQWEALIHTAKCWRGAAHWRDLGKQTVDTNCWKKKKNRACDLPSLNTESKLTGSSEFSTCATTRVARWRKVTSLLSAELFSPAFFLPSTDLASLKWNSLPASAYCMNCNRFKCRGFRNAASFLKLKSFSLLSWERSLSENVWESKQKLFCRRSGRRWSTGEKFQDVLSGSVRRLP